MRILCHIKSVIDVTLDGSNTTAHPAGEFVIDKCSAESPQRCKSFYVRQNTPWLLCT